MADEEPRMPEDREPTPDEWLALLKEGVDEFNRFRQEYPTRIPRFPPRAQLSEAGLDHVNLWQAQLESANLRAASLRGAYLRRAKLKQACLRRGLLEGVDLRAADLRNCDLRNARLQGALLNGADLAGSRLGEANLAGADLREVRGLEKASLRCVLVDSATRFLGTNTAAIRRRYPVLARAVEDAQFIEDYRRQHQCFAFLWRVTCDYGRSWMRWAFWAALIAVLFGLVFTFLTPGSFELRQGREATWFTYFYFSIVTFTTLGFGDVVPTNLWGEILLSLEVVLGYVMLGGLVSILATKLARRS